MPKITLFSDGETWTGFQSVSIRQSMDNAAHSFSLTTTDRGNEGLDRWNIRGGSEVQIYIDETLAFDGFVQRYNPRIDANSHSINIAGASRAIDLVECSHDGKYFWKDVSAESIISEVLEPFHIEYRIDGEMKRIEKTGFRVGVTDSPFAIVRKLAEKNGLTVYTDSNNTLILSNRPSETLFADIKRGQYLALEVNHDLSQSFSEVVVKAQQNSTSKDFKGKQQVERRFQNPVQTRHRPLIVSSNGTDPDQQNLGEYAKRRFAGNVLLATATVKAAFRDSNNADSKLWGINQLVFVDDPVADIRHNLLISEVEFNLSEGAGFQTNLNMRLPEAYSDRPAKRPQVRRSKGEFGELASAFLDENTGTI